MTVAICTLSEAAGPSETLPISSSNVLFPSSLATKWETICSISYMRIGEEATFYGRVSLGPTLLAKDGTNHFVLNMTSYHMATLPSNIQVLLFDDRCHGHSNFQDDFL